jgi:hypothetical protein
MDPRSGSRALLRRRLFNQHLIGSRFGDVADVVKALGAVQAQDYAAAKWALALRARRATDASIDRAIDDGKILRTHVLRPTWHFVAPRDIGWMLALTAPRVRAQAASSWRAGGLDEALFKRANATIERSLRDGQHLTRAELGEHLRRARVDPGDGTRLSHLMMRAELDAIVCSGARRGKQFTYALIDERVSETPLLTRDAALRELARRYFTTRGPATVHDFAWWSGLTVADARAGAHAAEDVLTRETIGDREHWCGRDVPASSSPARSVHLLPNYDEFLVAYRDRAAMAGVISAGESIDAKRAIFSNVLEIDGRIAGGWRRTRARASTCVELTPNRTLTPAEHKMVEAEASRYGEFLGLQVELTIVRG